MSFVLFVYFVDRFFCSAKNGSTNYTNYTNNTKRVEFNFEAKLTKFATRFSSFRLHPSYFKKSGARLRSPLRLRAPLVSDNREAGRSFFRKPFNLYVRTDQSFAT